MPTLLVLGAGFSKPAGFPLGTELFSQISDLARGRNLFETVLRPDIERYLAYQQATRGSAPAESAIDFEDFLSFLDIEHFLWLRGSDTWTEEGNRSQMLIRNLISLALHIRLEDVSPRAMDFYHQFASNLVAGDLVVTFNYDTLLETCLDDLGVPYRLVPDRFKSFNEWGGIVDWPERDVILLKVHGSIDWFNKARFDEWARERQAMGLPDLPRHPLFNDPAKCLAQPIVDGPYYPESPLLTIHRARNMGPYFSEATFLLEAPVLIAPASTKIAYLNPIKEFWSGFGREGAGFTRMGVVGFSLSRHDDYVKQPLYNLVSNYQATDTTILDNPKAPLVMIDHRREANAQDEYRASYRFVNWDKAIVCFDGLDEASLRVLFA